MAKPSLAALLLFGAAAVQSPPAAASVPLQPSVDSAEQRQALKDLISCMAEARPRWARRTLSRPYLSDAQASDAAQALNGSDTCLREDEAEITFRTSSVVAALAEHFLRADLARADFARVARALNTLPPLNVSEDFALCVAANDPAAARDLALSELGSEAEMAAARRVVATVEACHNPGEAPTVDLQALRALVSTALYRGVASVVGSEN